MIVSGSPRVTRSVSITPGIVGWDQHAGDHAAREALYGVAGRWLKGFYPVLTGIVVVALARPDWLVEIDVLAVKSAADAEHGG